METPRAITKWLPSKDMPFLKAEEERLTKKGWNVEIKSRRKTGLYDKSLQHILIVNNEDEKDNDQRRM